MRISLSIPPDSKLEILKEITKTWPSLLEDILIGFVQKNTASSLVDKTIEVLNDYLETPELDFRDIVEIMAKSCFSQRNELKILDNIFKQLSKNEIQAARDKILVASHLYRCGHLLHPDSATYFLSLCLKSCSQQDIPTIYQECRSELLDPRLPQNCEERLATDFEIISRSNDYK